jgi:cytochrome d ubiquinol oxidase subunit I
MDVLTLSRIQFGATVAFRYIYSPLSIGLSLMLVIKKAAWLKTRKPIYHQMAIGEQNCLEIKEEMVLPHGIEP